MKLYRHYKNKFYKFWTIARHSESLDEYAVYECLYDNPGGQNWIRPKELFFGQIELDGKLRDRFQKVDININTFTELSKDLVQSINDLSKSIFPTWDEAGFFSRLETHQKPILTLATIDGRSVGYKFGYELNGECFYSWLGGILPEFRGLGIARSLMTTQHEWAQTKGYKTVQTKTLNDNTNMLILNIRSGFRVVGTENSSRGFKVLLEKHLPNKSR